MNQRPPWDAFITPHNIQHNTSKLFSPFLRGICFGREFSSQQIKIIKKGKPASPRSEYQNFRFFFEIFFLDRYNFTFSLSIPNFPRHPHRARHQNCFFSPPNQKVKGKMEYGILLIFIFIYYFQSNLFFFFF